MILQLTDIILCSLFILSIKVSTEKNMIFHFITRSKSYLPTYLSKPLFECPACMNSIWGVIFFLILYRESFYLYLLNPVLSVPICYIIWEYIRSLKHLYEPSFSYAERIELYEYLEMCRESEEDIDFTSLYFRFNLENPYIKAYILNYAQAYFSETYYNKLKDFLNG